MCFSAQASFIVSGLLMTAGGASIYLARTRTLKLIGITPIIFGLQQAAEGVIWLTHATNYCALNNLATYFFIIIAMVIWPLWMPSIFLTTAKNRWQKIGMSISLLAGIVFSGYAAWHLLAYGTSSQAMSDHIIYATEHLQPRPCISGILYSLATIVPLLITPVHYMWTLALGIAVASLITTNWFYIHFASIWCFFAAVLSSCILLVILCNRRCLNKSNNK
jgi:hypothetical protein